MKSVMKTAQSVCLYLECTSAHSITNCCNSTLCLNVSSSHRQT